MKILVIGGSGVIGSKIVKYLKSNKEDVEFTYLNNLFPISKGHSLDITKKDQTVALVKKIKPDTIIHTTALTNVDLCETNKSLANSINVVGVKNIVDAAKDIDCRLVYVSTSAVYDGTRNEYTEDNKPSPISHYGLTKMEGEEIIRYSGLPYLILRTDQPYCWTEKWQHTNSVLRVLDTIRAHKTLKEIRDWYNTPTYVPDFVNVCLRLLFLNEKGIFHVVGTEFIDRYELSLRVAKVFGLDKNMIEPIESKMLNLPVKRANVRLNANKISRLGLKMSSIEEGLCLMLKSESNIS